VGDLAVAEPVEVAELKHQPLGVRQHAQRDADEAGLDGSQRFLVGELGRLASVSLTEPQARAQDEPQAVSGGYHALSR
jgi:hypothetical protein